MRKLISLQVVILAALVFPGCVDPKGNFDDFSDRVVDAAARPDAPPIGEIPDVTGEFYLSLSPAPTPTLLFRYIATTVLEEGPSGYTIDLSLQPLDRDTLEPVGDPQISDDVPVSEAGTFEAYFPDTIIPGRANPVSGQTLTADVTLVGQLRNEDLYCGDADGMVKSPLTLALDGSTFAAIRVEEGTTGTDLPEPVAQCPPTGDEDAGVPDAGAADAGLDAGLDAGD
jgi:hypothetical protein